MKIYVKEAQCEIQVQRERTNSWSRGHRTDFIVRRREYGPLLIANCFILNTHRNFNTKTLWYMTWETLRQFCIICSGYHQLPGSHTFLTQKVEFRNLSLGEHDTSGLPQSNPKKWFLCLQIFITRDNSKSME